MLATAYLGVYLAAIRGTVMALTDGMPVDRTNVAISSIFVGTLFILMSTMILLSFAESIMHISVKVMRYRRTRRQ